MELSFTLSPETQVERLVNTVMRYDWGSRTAIAELLGRPSPSEHPEAELWIGAHPSAPSLVTGDRLERTLAETIAAAPEFALGQHARGRFGDQLPFLLKVLAAEVPLSLQVHPNLEQARAGHAKEESSGIPLSAPERNYKDTRDKPEILCALGSFEALCGFRHARESLALLEELAVPALVPVADALRGRPGPAGVRAAFESVMSMDRSLVPALVAQVAAACRGASGTPAASRPHLDWIVALSERYPSDVGVVASLLLNHVRLEAGDAIHLPPGTLHTYLRGVGVELMTASDNVVRGGLTSKHVDVTELLAVLDFREGPVASILARPVCSHETKYVGAEPDFSLSTIRVSAGEVCRPARRGPELLLCVAGRAQATADGTAALEMAPGDSVFVPAGDPSYSVTGEATLYRAVVGEDDAAAPQASCVTGAS